MGYYNSIIFTNKKGEEVELQFKSAGEYDPQSFVIGDEITTSNGIHFTFEGCFVVAGGKIVAAFDNDENHLFTKWGHIIPPPDLGDCNPLQAAINKINK